MECRLERKTECYCAISGQAWTIIQLDLVPIFLSNISCTTETTVDTPNKVLVQYNYM